MYNISDIIENYLNHILSCSDATHVDVKRNELASKFQCVPSQVNYVINTRFTPDKGFLIQSKRGGGGYIRIIKVTTHSRNDFLTEVSQLIGVNISQKRAENLLIRLREEKIITQREKNIISDIIERNVLSFFDHNIRDKLRAQIMQSFIKTLTYEEQADYF